MADRLENVGKHLLKDSLTLVGTDDSSNLFFLHRRPKDVFFLSIPNSGQCW